MQVVNCHMCGGRNEAEDGASICQCEYCGSTFPLPKAKEKRIENLFNKANYYRINNEFDRATSAYENILNEDYENADAHWGIVLCRYGVEYVKDERTDKRIPICHRTLLTAIYSDPNYKETIKYADVLSKSVYETEASKIADIQKHIIEISSKEKPYDVFICYKEADEMGNRTEDSSIAQDICTYLTSEGLNVFYSRITLRSKAGSEYEPYIFAALNSAKVMLVIGTKQEYINAPWVKNEWGRFLAFIKNNKTGSKVLIPCYKNISPYDLPDEFFNYEALDMTTPTFMVDLIRSIRNVIKANKKEEKKVEVVSTLNSNAAALARRGYIYLEDGEFVDAKNCFDKSLDLSPEISSAYWGLVLSREKCRNNNELIQKGKPITDLNEYKKAIRFASDEEKQTYNNVVLGINNIIETTIKRLRAREVSRLNSTNIQKIILDKKKVIEDKKKHLKEALSQLVVVENNIKECVQQCRDTINPTLDEISQCFNRSETIKNDIHKRDIDFEEKTPIKQNIAEINKILDSGATFISKTTDSHENYLRLKALLKRQKEIIDIITEDKRVLKEIVNTMHNFQDKMYSIDRTFLPAYSQVREGGYNLSNAILSGN